MGMSHDDNRLRQNISYCPTKVAAFNHPRWAKLVLTDKQVHDLGTQIPFTFTRDARNRPVASHHCTYPDGAIPIGLEVFRISVANNGTDCVYEMRLGIDMPDFLAKVLGGKVTTTEGQEIHI